MYCPKNVRIGEFPVMGCDQGESENFRNIAEEINSVVRIDFN